jgi:uncharacterized protein
MYTVALVSNAIGDAMSDAIHDDDVQYPPVTQLKKFQRRVLGVLVEKAFTTPEYYPMTLKALTAGCNQKSNRSPVYNLSEDAVFDTLDELREMGLAAVRHTESGRTERFRHNMRQRYSFTEPQLAILIELLLRGRQSMGELRTRASRMVAIESLADLRRELGGLIEEGYAQSNGPLERRGIQVDHNMYLPAEDKTMEPDSATVDQEVAPTRNATTPTAATAPSVAAPDLNSRLAQLESIIERQSIENRSLREELDSLKGEVHTLQKRLEDLCRDLGN